MRPMANVVGGPVQRRTIISDLGWPLVLSLERNNYGITLAATTQPKTVEVQKLVDQHENKNKMLLCFFSFTTECLLVTQMASEFMQKEEPNRNV